MLSMLTNVNVCVFVSETVIFNLLHRRKCWKKCKRKGGGKTENSENIAKLIKYFFTKNEYTICQVQRRLSQSLLLKVQKWTKKKQQNYLIIEKMFDKCDHKKKFFLNIPLFYFLFQYQYSEYQPLCSEMRQPSTLKSHLDRKLLNKDIKHLKWLPFFP